MSLAAQRKWEGNFKEVCQLPEFHKELEEQMTAMAK